MIEISGASKMIRAARASRLCKVSVIARNGIRWVRFSTVGCKLNTSVSLTKATLDIVNGVKSICLGNSHRYPKQRR